jgi:ABC-type transporter Mla maintaining outer membrane lipid asymmetry ATPase subunit MlaF
MKALAIRYRRRTERHDIDVSVPQAGVTRVHVPDEDAKAHLVTAILKARGEPGEELELYGKRASSLPPRERASLRSRIGAVSPIVGLMPNLNTWENIALPAAYHGRPSLERVAEIAREVLGSFGADASEFFTRLPEQLGVLERKLATFVRGLVAGPQLMVFDALEDGLSFAECRHAARFESEYRSRQPLGTLVYVDTREEA